MSQVSAKSPICQMSLLIDPFEHLKEGKIIRKVVIPTSHVRLCIATIQGTYFCLMVDEQTKRRTVLRRTLNLKDVIDVYLDNICRYA